MVDSPFLEPFLNTDTVKPIEVKRAKKKRAKNTSNIKYWFYWVIQSWNLFYIGYIILS